MKILAIFFLLTTQVFATTIQWDHDCSDADGFYVYLADENLDNFHSISSIDCPTVQATVYDPGWYFVTAYNEYGESEQSNTIELAGYYYNAIRIEYTAVGLPKYRGENTNQDAATSDTDWTIKKYYYDANDRLILIRIRTTSWDDRDTGW